MMFTMCSMKCSYGSQVVKIEFGRNYGEHDSCRKRHSGFCQSPHKVIVGPSPTTSTPCRWSAEAVIPASLAPLSWPPEVFTSHSHIVSPGSPRSVFRRKGSSHLHLPTVISAPKKRKVPSPLATILSRATALPRCSYICFFHIQCLVSFLQIQDTLVNNAWCLISTF
ncbi:uncharacterized protein LOC110430112 [Sorghum bicolor]|uniref:uncharacterized protein LOC110430112 n=1 Tax=Sorghum bicolor TaxID=4558 RepID=UPI000B425D0D|nr:uncharacterized protein LOC110430112 [Sorghum bicolor]XP_021302784.1 uncharacterized protein LOC110430112 [Sorghum bicolor]|eukprot:XP_021302783.1 uncharacterized protein LOC110430112 [Sorghum bicolor]